MKICILKEPRVAVVHHETYLLIPGQEYENDAPEVKLFSFAFEHVIGTPEDIPGLPSVGGNTGTTIEASLEVQNLTFTRSTSQYGNYEARVSGKYVVDVLDRNGVKIEANIQKDGDDCRIYVDSNGTFYAVVL